MENSKKLNSFELISTTETLEFYSKNHLDMINVHRVLKNKLSLSGFHEHFKAVKKIGRGNFAIVNQKSQFILIFSFLGIHGPLQHRRTRLCSESHE